jgi:glycosyltransferase involved in cell wall biosynthesis
MKISLVILTYNEIVGLMKVLSAIPLSAVDEILAVDGGSTDGTVEFLKAHDIPVHFQTIKGRGEAFHVAFKKASGDALILFSPDGNEDPNDIPKFRPYLEAGNDIVIATRMVKGARNEEDDQIFRWRKWVNIAFTVMANVLWNRNGRFVSDTINGFRAITRKAWDILALDGPGYTIEYQGSIRAMKLGLDIAEFPTCESARIDGREGSPGISTGIAFCRIFLREMFLGKRWRPLHQD